jgi:thiol-disulfide isomerase/thioredoxin
MKRLAFVVLFLTFSSVAEDKLQSFDINHYKNRVVYLDFWASWCIPCRKSFPWMNAMHEKYKDQGLSIIAINLDEDKADASKFLSLFPAQFMVQYDDGKLAEKYQVQGMPFSVLFDGNGQIIHKSIGFKKKNTQIYEQQITQALGISEQ